MAIWSSFVKKSRSGKKPGPPVRDDLVRRDFSATVMNQLWFTDLTEHMTSEGKLYLCSLEDAFSTRIVGYSIGERMTSASVCRPCATPSPFAVRWARSVIAITARNSPREPSPITSANTDLWDPWERSATAYDSPMESFWGTMQIELLNRKRWTTVVELSLAIANYIENFYHRERRHSSLDYFTPHEFETLQSS